MINVIFFDDRKKTKAFQLSKKSLISLIVGLSFVLLWNLISFFLITFGLIDISQLKKKLTQAQTIIFEYESEYNSSFSKAYPNQIIEEPAKEEEAL